MKFMEPYMILDMAAKKSHPGFLKGSYNESLSPDLEKIEVGRRVNQR